MIQSLLIVSLFAVLSSPPPGYELVGKHADVSVYKRSGSKSVELFAEGDMPAPPSRVQEVLLDYEHHGRFVKDVAESHVVKREPSVFWVYQRLDLPMIADRDFTLKVTWGHEGDSLYTHFVCDSEQGPPERKGVVRVTVHEGHWTLTPIEGGKATHARYQVHLELGGSLPLWMTRSGAAKNVPELFEGLRRQLQP